LCWEWVAAAILAAVCYAGLDEFPQAFVPARTASIYDLLLDSFGAAVAQLFPALRTLLASRSFT
jgi:VanZ family protein